MPRTKQRKKKKRRRFKKEKEKEKESKEQPALPAPKAKAKAKARAGTPGGTPRDKKLSGCYAFQKGECKNGDACEYGHFMKETDTPRDSPRASTKKTEGMTGGCKKGKA